MMALTSRESIESTNASSEAHTASRMADSTQAARVYSVVPDAYAREAASQERGPGPDSADSPHSMCGAELAPACCQALNRMRAKAERKWRCLRQVARMEAVDLMEADSAARCIVRTAEMRGRMSLIACW